MSNDVADGTPVEEPKELPLPSLALIGALARAMEEHQEVVIKPRKDAPKVPLVEGFLKERRKDLVVDVDGVEVGYYKVSTTRDRFEVADRSAFDAYAEGKGEIDIVITAKPAFEKAALKHATVSQETGTVFDRRTGEEIPGVKFVPGGQPTGNVTWTWKKRNGEPVGKDVLLRAYRGGRLDELLKETPELLPTRQPGASDE
ncbi:hypothetical protein IM697_18065 [Streptomyces ferrugineus]|uniref:Uncharacterized protein n=1 Tax=Streptomyces ferrugineus TaxID=1413221 RepID=A0A7M2SV54_9ACTN|nr:hypothetical protein [Streptomyces ferrugineus]QOV40134.1 hypothetical protein IM697_18065 [Streptomyces ferrugineus]